MSKIIHWQRKKDQYISDIGFIYKNNDQWVGLVKDGFGIRICGNFSRVRSAMTAVENAAKSESSPLPPILFPVHIY